MLVIGTIIGMLAFWPLIGLASVSSSRTHRWPKAAPDPPRKPVWRINLILLTIPASLLTVLYLLGDIR